MSVKKKIYKNYRKYLDESFVVPFVFLESYNNLKKRLGAIYLKKLKRLYINKIRYRPTLKRKLPLLVKMIPRKKKIIWNRFLRQNIIFINYKNVDNKNKKYYRKRNLTDDEKLANMFKVDLTKVPDKYLYLVPYIDEPSFSFLFENLDFDFKTYRYKRKYKKIDDKQRIIEELKKKTILEKPKTLKEYLLRGRVWKRNSLKKKISPRCFFTIPRFSRFFRFKKQKTKFGVKLFGGKKMRFFYGFLPYKQILKLYNKTFNNKRASSNKVGHLYDFISSLESKLDIFLWRSGFFSNIFECQNVIKNKKVLVNGCTINTSYFFLKNFDIVSFDKSFHMTLRRKLLFNIKNRSFLYHFFDHCQINYSTFDMLFNKKLLNFNSLESLSVFGNSVFRKNPNDNYLGIFDKKKCKKLENIKRMKIKKLDNNYNSYYFPYKSNSEILKELISEKVFF